MPSSAITSGWEKIKLNKNARIHTLVRAHAQPHAACCLWLSSRECVCARSHWSLSFFKPLVFDSESSARLSAVSLPTLKGFSPPPPPAPTETSCFVPRRKLNYRQLIWNWEIRLGFAGRGPAVLGNLSCAKAVQAEKSQPIDNESYSSATLKKKEGIFSFPFLWEDKARCRW